jgi:nucleotide-binding universal stress UspA family protein
MYDKILVPLDGSKFSERILPYVRYLSKALKIPVELLQVNEPEALTAFSPPLQGADYLKGVADSLQHGAGVRSIVEMGKPAEVIVHLAASSPRTLIAMATHGRSGVKRWVLGSIAEEVLHAAFNPLLLVRGSEEQVSGEGVILKRIFVPLDGSQLAEKVLPHVIGLAKGADLSVILVRTYALPLDVYGEGYGVNSRTFLEEIKNEAQSYLEKKVEELKGGGLARVSFLLIEGNAAAEILQLVEGGPDSLVMMCTHGRSGIGRWVLGSVTERVVRHSREPVLVIRASSQD